MSSEWAAEDRDKYNRVLAVIDRAQEFQKHFASTATDPIELERSRQSAKEAISAAYVNWELDGQSDIPFDGGAFPCGRTKSLRSQLTYHINKAWQDGLPAPNAIDRDALVTDKAIGIGYSKFMDEISGQGKHPVRRYQESIEAMLNAIAPDSREVGE